MSPPPEFESAGPRRAGFGRRLRLLVLAGSIAGLAPGCALKSGVLPADVESLVDSHVESLMASDFPELRGLAIEYRPVDEGERDDVFFATSVREATVHRKPPLRTYRLLANPRLSAERPDPEALHAILAHELIHLRDYLRMGPVDLILLRKDYRDDRFRREYERRTDLRVLEMGFGPELSRYRRWLYGVIRDPEKVAEQQRVYLTPEEIEAWLAGRR